MRKIALTAAVFLAGIALGAAGLWMISSQNGELSQFLLDHPSGNTPQKRIDAFISSIRADRGRRAFTLWEIEGSASQESANPLKARRKQVIADLVGAGITNDTLILGTEWWTTCCEPHVTCREIEAGGARVSVQVLDKDGNPQLYIFDVFNREQPYWGGAEGYRRRDWVIRDVYPFEEEPLYWPFLFDPKVRFVSP